MITLEASYGKVTFSHTLHAEFLDCATCHAEGTPGPIELNKTTAHALCKDCHKEQSAGPTGCKDCHIKD
ncbi:MAG: cytochrome c3 family protein [Desulfuromonadales bacterium]|nr:cytochrome c3 family protein [Desulfuromonadales bacterium]